MSDEERDRRQFQALHEEVRALRHLAMLGRLAGGVAHDFNNQLTSILGYTDLLLATAPEGEPEREDLLEIRRAAERATVITQQMLAFSRPHAAQPGFVNLADVLMDSVRLLRRVFGPDVQLATTLPAEPVIVQADPVHIGHALLHLALHARDTLRDGGSLVFDLSSLDGIRVAGTREPSSPLLAHLRVQAVQPPQPATALPTPPTTPPAAAQPAALSAEALPGATDARHAGDATPASHTLDIVTHLLAENDARFRVDADAEPFAATLEFPVVTVDAQSVALRTAPPRGHETVMVVEDDAAVRTFMRTTLERHGYQVLAAQGPNDALGAIRAAGSAIDLVIVDLVLPGGGGEPLAANMQALRTGVRVLYISGQSDCLAADRPPLTPAGILLAKPFSANRLLLGVRQALDTTPGSAPSPSAS